MQGLGNDFVVINNIEGGVCLSTDEIRQLADRRLGIGFDQLLMVENSSLKGVDFRYVIYNADGSEVGQCGNGVGNCNWLLNVEMCCWKLRKLLLELENWI